MKKAFLQLDSDMLADPETKDELAGLHYSWFAFPLSLHPYLIHDLLEHERISSSVHNQ